MDEIRKKESETRSANIIFSLKEFFDKIGFGFGGTQFINILFMISGAGYWLILLGNALKNIISVVASYFFKEISKIRLSKNFISTGGIIYGFSFLGLALATLRNLPLLFLISLLIGVIGVVSYGDSYTLLLNQKLKKEKRNIFLKSISKLGLLITAACLFLSGLLMDKVPIYGKEISFIFLGRTFEFMGYGYLLAFEITAIMFILSGYVLSFLKNKKEINQHVDINRVLKEKINFIRQKIKIYSKNKLVVLLFLAGTISSLAQTIANSFYGIHIYTNFGESFLNVGFVFLIALLGAPLGLILTKKLIKIMGLFPLLVFGILLMTITPLVYFMQGSLILLTIGTLIGILGGAIVGISHSILGMKIVPPSEKQSYYDMSGFLILIPYILLLPLALLLVKNLNIAFLASIILFLLSAIPYFMMVLSYKSYN